MVTDKDCLDKWGTPTPTVKWENSTGLTLWRSESSLSSQQVIWSIFPEQQEYSKSCLPNKIYMNKLMVDPFTKAIKDLIAARLLDDIRTWNGCYNIRRMKVVKNGKIAFSSKYSLHSWGIAFDIDAAWNQLGKKGDLNPAIVEIFKKNGFDWGGDFKVEDSMHFQLKEI